MSEFPNPTPLTRQITSRTVLRAIMENAPVSRAELARMTGLSKQAMSEIVRDLEAEGWVRETGKTQGAVGRSAINYEVEPRKAIILGVDIGGTKLHAAIADLSGGIIEEVIEPTDSRGGPHLIDQIARLTQAMLDKASVPADAVRMGVVGIPGAVHPKARRITMVPNIPGIVELDFEALLSRRLGFPILLENDVNIAAKGEQRMGHGRESDNFVFVALGTGIGMGIVNEGRLVRGARGAAGEISTLPVGGDPFDSRAFASGVLESAIGSAAIRARYEGLGGEPGLTVREIFSRDEDGAVPVVIDEVARVLATAIVAIAAVVDPEVVIFGGSVGARAELTDRVRHHLSRCMPVPPACTTSALGSQAGIIGAIAVAVEEFRKVLFEMPVRSGGDAVPANVLEKAG